MDKVRPQTPHTASLIKTSCRPAAWSHIHLWDKDSEWLGQGYVGQNSNGLIWHPKDGELGTGVFWGKLPSSVIWWTLIDDQPSPKELIKSLQSSLTLSQARVREVLEEAGEYSNDLRNSSESRRGVAIVMNMLKAQPQESLRIDMGEPLTQSHKESTDSVPLEDSFAPVGGDLTDFNEREGRN